MSISTRMGAVPPARGDQRASSTPPIAVLKAERGGRFRRAAQRLGRHYLYRIVNRRAPLTLDRGRAWRVKLALDAGAMHEAAQALVGRHDFSTFRDVAMPGQFAGAHARAPRRRPRRRRRSRRRALSFLHRQVRSMVGSLVEVGLGRWSPPISRRRWRPPTAAAAGRLRPACGLYLARVDYAAAYERRRQRSKARAPRVDARQRLEIVDGDALVDRVHGGADEAEFDHRAGVLDEARVGRAAAGRQLGLPPVTSSIARRRDR